MRAFRVRACGLILAVCPKAILFLCFGLMLAAALVLPIMVPLRRSRIAVVGSLEKVWKQELVGCFQLA